MTREPPTKILHTRHWIVSGVSAVLILHAVGFFLIRAVSLALIAGVDIGPHVHMTVISVQLTAIVAWIYLPFALYLLRRATLRGAGGFRRAAAIGFFLTTTSWCIVGPLTQMLITSLIGASILSGMAIGLMTWFILTLWVPQVETRAPAT